MTREQKLALLIGFTLVLVVGVVISDHLSGASRAELEGGVASLDAARDPLDDALTSALPTHDTPPPARRFVAPSAETLPSVGFERGPTPVDPTPIEMGRAMAQAEGSASEAGPAPRSSLAALFERHGGTIRNGVLHLAESINDAPAAAQTDLVRREEVEEERPDTRSATARRSAPRRYVVREGDTLWEIAKRTYGDGSLHEALASANEGRVGRDGTVFEGATILLPEREELSGGAPAATEGTRDTAQPGDTARDRAVERRRYTVKRGDTLGEIAAALLGSSKRWPEIVRANEDVIDDPDSVPAGVVLTIPPR
jgi:nucleoid-associated protein YgaU